MSLSSYASMSKYSSVLFGAEAYEKIGPFRFAVWKELVPGEVRGFERIARKQAQSSFKSIKLAQKLAEERKIPVKEALDILSNLSTQENEDLLYRFAEELDEIQSLSLSEHAQKLEYVTLFMQYRGEVKMPGSREYEQTKDWTMDDTEKMPTKLLEAIHDLLVKERDGWDTKGKAQPEQEPES